MKKLRLVITVALLAGAAALLVIQHGTLARLSDENDQLRRQAAQSSNLTAENERLSNEVSRAGRTLTDAERGELLRLRGEVATLRRQKDELARLREENQSLRGSIADAGQRGAAAPATDQPDHTATIPRINNARSLAHSLLLFAADHDGNLPSDLGLLGVFFPGLPTLAGTNDFEIVYHGSLNELTNAGSVMMIRERDAWQLPDGTWTKAYGFADGHAEIHSEPDASFDPWERQRMFSPPSQTATPEN